jgi:hypothetical protein
MYDNFFNHMLLRPPMSVIEKASRTPLDPKLMKRMLTCINEMPAEQRGDMTGRSIGLIRFLEENLSSQETFDRASTIISFEFRMQALTLLRKRPEYRAWAMKTEHSGAPDLIHEVLIETAAMEPLIERNKRPAFNPVTFFRAALESAESEGRA